MTQFEYTTVTWLKGFDQTALGSELNEFGAQGWEAVGIPNYARRGATVRGQPLSRTEPT